jgi:hypothetical protein
MFVKGVFGQVGGAAVVAEASLMQTPLLAFLFASFLVLESFLK